MNHLLALANCHMVDYIICNLWEKHVSPKLRNELDSLPYKMLSTIVSPSEEATKTLGEIASSLVLKTFISVTRLFNL